MRKSRLGLILVLLLLFLAGGQAAASPLVNMNVVNTDVRDVLTALASVGKVNIVADDSVSGKITIQLVNTPFETALDLVVKTKGLTCQRMGDVLVVGAADKISKGFGAVEIIKLNYAKAVEVKKSLLLVLPEDRLKVDEATNSIVFSGSPEETERVKAMLAGLDVAYQQVSLEAQVISLDKTASKELGVDWSWESAPQSPTVTAPTYSVTVDSSGNPVMTQTTPQTVTRSVNEGVIRFGRNPEGYPYEFYYQFKIKALVTNGKANILAKPNVTTIDGQEARILIGDRIPVVTEHVDSAGKTNYTTEYVDAGIKLTYTPRIGPDGWITAKVHTEVSTPTLVPEIKAYQIATREAETNVRMKDGQTMVIGGLIGKQETNTRKKLPFLGDFPILGKLFSSDTTSKDETEVVIFLTARIVK